MCGRYTLSTHDGPALAQRFALVEPPPEETLRRFNVCPTEEIAVVPAPGRVEALPWGLWPLREGGPRPINARAETLAAKPMWKRLLGRGRCLVLADGWYEWLREERRGGARTPFRYTVDGGAPFAFAGLGDGRSAAILTTRANGICAPVHDRMPCVLEGPEAEAAWLSGDVGPDAALELLRPLEDARVGVAAANPAVNRAGVEGPELLVAPAGGGGAPGAPGPPAGRGAGAGAPAADTLF